MQFKLYKGGDRGLKDIGWLQSNLSFSFSNFYHPVERGFGLLRVFNDDFVTPDHGFGLHPHTNMEIISVMLAGSMSHQDSMGYKEVVKKDWVQIMSAGSGLRHEEYNVGQDTVNFLQIWIEPKMQNVTPRYQRRCFPEADRQNKLVTIVSSEEGQAHCWINQNAKLSLGYFTRGEDVTYTFNPMNKGVYVFVIDGTISVNGERLDKRDAIGVWATDTLAIHALDESRFLVIEVPINH